MGLVKLYKIILKPLVDWTTNHLSSLSKQAAIVLTWRGSCSNTLASVRAKEGASSDITRAVERTCNNKVHSAEAFVVALGLLLASFIILARPTFILFLTTLRTIIGFRLADKEKVSPQAASKRPKEPVKLKKEPKKTKIIKKEKKKPQ